MYKLEQRGNEWVIVDAAGQVVAGPYQSDRQAIDAAELVGIDLEGVGGGNTVRTGPWAGATKATLDAALRSGAMDESTYRKLLPDVGVTGADAVNFEVSKNAPATQRKEQVVSFGNSQNFIVDQQGNPISKPYATKDLANRALESGTYQQELSQYQQQQAAGQFAGAGVGASTGILGNITGAVENIKSSVKGAGLSESQMKDLVDKGELTPFDALMWYVAQEEMTPENARLRLIAEDMIRPGVSLQQIQQAAGAQPASLTTGTTQAAPSTYTGPNADFYNTYGPSAQKFGAQYGVDPAVLLAINASETNWGAAPGFMGFGITGSGTAGSRTLTSQGSDAPGSSVAFAQYNNPDEAYQDFFDLITQGRYAGAWANFQKSGDSLQLVRDLQQSGYTPATDWPGLVASLSQQTSQAIGQGALSKTAGVQGYMPSWASATISQGFGPTNEKLDSGYAGYANFNKGIDYAVAEGTPIDANIAGTVIASGDQGDGWGISVKVRDANGFIHNYGHLSAANVAVGQQINPGDILGASGNTGKSTGPHLSYDVMNANGEFIEPTAFVTGAAAGPAGSIFPDAEAPYTEKQITDLLAAGLISPEQAQQFVGQLYSDPLLRQLALSNMIQAAQSTPATRSDQIAQSARFTAPGQFGTAELANRAMQAHGGLRGAVAAYQAQTGSTGTPNLAEIGNFFGPTVGANTPVTRTVQARGQDLSFTPQQAYAAAGASPGDRATAFRDLTGSNLSFEEQVAALGTSVAGSGQGPQPVQRSQLPFVYDRAYQHFLSTGMTPAEADWRAKVLRKEARAGATDGPEINQFGQPIEGEPTTYTSTIGGETTTGTSPGAAQGSDDPTATNQIADLARRYSIETQQAYRPIERDIGGRTYQFPRSLAQRRTLRYNVVGPDNQIVQSFTDPDLAEAQIRISAMNELRGNAVDRYEAGRTRDQMWRNQAQGNVQTFRGNWVNPSQLERPGPVEPAVHTPTPVQRPAGVPIIQSGKSSDPNTQIGLKPFGTPEDPYPDLMGFNRGGTVAGAPMGNPSMVVGEEIVGVGAQTGKPHFMLNEGPDGLGGQVVPELLNIQPMNAFEQAANMGMMPMRPMGLTPFEQAANLESMRRKRREIVAGARR